MIKSNDLWPADPEFFKFSAAVKASLRADDRFLVSYPRSGNTWMRYVLTAACLLQSGEDLPLSEAGVARVHEMAVEVLPDIHAAPLRAAPHPLTGLPYRVIKSHNLREVTAHEIVYLFRRPEDSLLSYAHYAGRAGALGADRFVIHQVRTWAAEARFALDCHRKNPSRIWLLSYENILERTAESVTRIAGCLGLKINAECRDRAIALNDFRRLKSFEQTGPETGLALKGGIFFRGGVTGSGRRELRAETIEAVQALAQPVYEELCAAAGE